MEESIHLVLRLRPPRSQNGIYWRAKETKVQGEEGEYNADAVYDFKSTNQDIFKKNVREMVEKCCVGYNTAVMAYGQSGAGKTHTLLGGGGEDGLVNYVVRQMFEEVEIQQKSSCRSFLVQLQILELYCEKIRDLLIEHSSSIDRKILEANSIPRVTDLKEISVTSADQALEIIRNAQSRRVVASTELNDQSSRSHAIIQLTIESSLTTDIKARHKCRRSVMNIVDLAGSENVGANSGIRAKEGNMINLSLLTLAKVINQLTEKSGQAHISYRDSKLTRLLKPCLGGNSNTLIICCVDPQNKDESLRTLKFSERLKLVTAHVQVNEEEEGGQLAVLMSEIERLNRELADVKKAKVKEDGEEKQKRLLELHALFLHGSELPKADGANIRAVRRQTIGVFHKLPFGRSSPPKKLRPLMLPKVSEIEELVIPQRQSDPAAAILASGITERRSDPLPLSLPTADIQELEDLRHKNLHFEIESKRTSDEISSFKKKFEDEREELERKLHQAVEEKSGVEAAISTTMQEKTEQIAQLEFHINQLRQQHAVLLQEHDVHDQLVEENTKLKTSLTEIKIVVQELEQQRHCLYMTIDRLSVKEKQAEELWIEVKKLKDQAAANSESVSYWKNHSQNASKDCRAAESARSVLKEECEKRILDKDAEIERLKRMIDSEKTISLADRQRREKIKAELEDKFEKLMGSSQEKAQRLMETQCDLRRALQDLEVFQTQFSESVEKELAPLRDQNYDLRKSADRLQAELQESSQTANGLKQELETQKAICDRAMDELQRLRNNQEIAATLASREQLKKVKDMARKIIDLEDEMEALKEKEKSWRRSAQVQPGHLEERVASLANNLAWTESQLHTITQEKQEVEEQLKTSIESLRSKDATLNRGIEQYNELRAKYNLLVKKYKEKFGD